MGRKVAALARRKVTGIAVSGDERSEGRDASGHLAGVQELGDGLDYELRLVDLLDVRGARYDH